MSETTNVFDENEDDDRRTFGPSNENRDVLELLVKQGHFKSSLGAFQAAAMLALRKELDTSEAPLSSGTMWNRGSVNLGMLDFLGWYLQTSAPVRAFAQLGNVGTAYISDKVHTGGYTFTEIFELHELDIE